MKELGKLGVTLLNIYLIFSLNILQVLGSDRPRQLGGGGGRQRRASGDADSESDTKEFSSRRLQYDTFSPSRQFGDFGNKISTESGSEGIADRRYSSEYGTADLADRRYSSRGSGEAGGRRVRKVKRRRYNDIDETRSEEYQAAASYNRRPYGRRQPSNGDRHIPQQYSQQSYDRDSYSRESYAPAPAGYDREVVPSRYYKTPYQEQGKLNYFESIRPNHPTDRYNSGYDQLRREENVRFPNNRPEPQDAELEALDTQAGGGGGPNLLGALFGLLRPGGSKPTPRPTNEPSYEFVYNDVEYSVDKNSLKPDSDTFIPGLGDYDDYNLDYQDNKNTNALYDFKDVVYSIRNNESRIETLKKFLSAVNSFTDRAGTDPSFMMFNLPITLLALMGGFYAVSAVAVIGYKYFLLTTGSTNGNSLSILPVAVVFIVPALVVTVFLVARSAIDGQINLGGLARGDLKKGLRQDFDPVGFGYDFVVGSSALLGLGWLVSVAL